MASDSMLGWQEVFLVLAILLFVFGPAELPKIARELGKAWHEFNKASSGAIGAVMSTQEDKEEDKIKLLSEVAGQLHVEKQGKTEQQLTKEILEKILNKEEKPS